MFSNAHTHTLIHTYIHTHTERERKREICVNGYFTSSELIEESQLRKGLIHQEIIEGKVSVLHYSFRWLVKN